MRVKSIHDSSGMWFVIQRKFIFWWITLPMKFDSNYQAQKYIEKIKK